MSKNKSSKKKKPVIQTLSSTRNTVALNPLLKKAAIHEKTVKAKRRSNKMALKKTWFEQDSAAAGSCQSHVIINLSIGCAGAQVVQ